MEDLYNINNIIKIKINHKKQFRLFKRIDEPFIKYRVPKLNEIDLELNIGKFQPDLNRDDLISIDYNFYCADNYLYIKDFEGRMGRCEWECDIKGFEESNNLIINFYVKLPFLKRLVVPNSFSIWLIVRPLLYYKLAQKKCILLHAGALKKDNFAFILCGRSGTYKTSLMMDLIRHHKWNLISDEHILLKDRKLFPLNLSLNDDLLYYGIRHLKDEKFPIYHKIKFLFEQIYAKSTTNISIMKDDFFGYFYKKIFILNLKHSGNFSISRLDSEIARKKLFYNDICEWNQQIGLLGVNSGRMYEYLSMNGYANPEKNIEYYWKDYNNLLDEILTKTEIFSVDIPSNYVSEYARKLNEFLESPNR